MPIGVWSTSSTRSIAARQPSMRVAALPHRVGPALRALRDDGLHVGEQHVARERALARAADAGHGDQAAAAARDVDAAAGCAACAPWTCSASSARRRSSRVGDRRGAAAADAPAACARKRPVIDSACDASSVDACPRATSRPPRLPAPGPMSMMWSARRIVSSSCSTTTSVLPLSPSLRERVEQDRGCRAGAGRWSARRARSRRPAGCCRAAPRGGCAAPRRPRASARRGRASR